MCVVNRLANADYVTCRNGQVLRAATLLLYFAMPSL